MQEHWLRNDGLRVLSNVGNDVSYWGSSGMSDDVMLTGRPYGGVAGITSYPPTDFTPYRFCVMHPSIVRPPTLRTQ